jgi:hypothetical protein
VIKMMPSVAPEPILSIEDLSHPEAKRLAEQYDVAPGEVMALVGEYESAKKSCDGRFKIDLSDPDTSLNAHYVLTRQVAGIAILYFELSRSEHVAFPPSLVALPFGPGLITNQMTPGSSRKAPPEVLEARARALVGLITKIETDRLNQMEKLVESGYNASTD